MAGKNRLQQAVDKWQKKYCESSNHILKLEVRVREVQSNNTARTNEIAKQESALSTKMAETEADIRTFRKEQDDWRYQRSQSLDGAELAAVQQIWLDLYEKKVKPELMKKLRGESYWAARTDLERKYKRHERRPSMKL